MKDLNFRDIKLNKDLDTILREDLAFREDIDMPELSTWTPGDTTRMPFSSYTDYATSIDTRQDSDAYLDSLDFENDGLDIEEITNEVYIQACDKYDPVEITGEVLYDEALSLGFDEAVCEKVEAFWNQQKEDLEEEDEESLYTEALDDDEESQEEAASNDLKGKIYNAVTVNFHSWLWGHSSFRDVLTGEDIYEISAGIIDTYYNEVVEKLKKGEITQDIISEELDNPHFFDAIIANRVEAVTKYKVNKLNYSIPKEALEECKISERSLHQQVQDIVGYVVTYTNPSTHRRAYLSWDPVDEYYFWSVNMDDAELFESFEDARDLLKERINEITGDVEDIDVRAIYSSDYQIKEAYSEKDEKRFSKMLNESRMADVDIICDEFVHKHPGIKGELSVRLAHELKQELVDILHINPNLAYEIAETYLEDRYGQL